MAVRLVTVNQFLEKAGLDAAVISNTEVIEHFILERDLDEYIFGMVPSDVLRNYAEHLLNNEPINYDSLFQDMPQIENDQRDMKDLTHLAVVRMEGGRVKSLLVDYTIGKAYFSRHGFILHDVCYAEKTIPLTDEIVSDIAKELAAAELPSSGKEYMGDTNYRLYTCLLIAFEDGVVQYVSRGLDSDMPLSITKICQQMIMKFANL